MKPKQASYNQILKATSIIGGSSIINIILGIIRTKVFAVFLGPSGVGLIGIYTSITSAIGMMAGMGIANSGVRQIAEAVGNGDENKIALSITTLRYTSRVLGVAGALLLLVAARPISQLTFSASMHVGALIILSITILLATIADGQSAVIQGIRRIADLAKIKIYGGFWGTALCIPIIYLFRDDGIVPMLLLLSLVTTMTSWWYTRRIKVLKVKIRWNDIRTEVYTLLGLGFVFMASGIMSTAAAYLIRLIIVRLLGIEAAGQYQAAWALSGIYVGFILGAMAADFYPRLTAIAKDDTACNRLVNEQTEVALLLAVPGILATIIFAPIVIRVFYSVAFTSAVDLLRWQILGALLKVAAWPLGFILLAKGAGKLFLLTETLFQLISLASTWFCLSWFGLVGAGVAYFVTNIFYWLIVFIIVCYYFGFVLSSSIYRVALIAFPTVGIAFSFPFWLSQLWVILIGGFLTVIVGLLSVKCILRLIDPSQLPEWLRLTAYHLRLLSLK